MTAPKPDFREYRSQEIRVSDLTVDGDLISDARFDHCELIGPAVLALLDEVTMTDPKFDAPGPEALFWPVEKGRIVMGAVGLLRVEFVACTFTRIGLAVLRSQMDDLTAGINAGPPQ